MRTQLKHLGPLLIMAGLCFGAVACGDSKSSAGDEALPDLGNNGGGDTAGQNGDSAGDNTGSNSDADGGATGSGNGNGNGNGNGSTGDDCLANPTTNEEILNRCAPEGVDSRSFDNAARITGYSQPLPDLP